MAAQTPTEGSASAAAAVATPPRPEECGHPGPIVGVMAREFSHYQGAIGPEGTRRTSTYYGPVIGGLPIQAWHCQACGLLRLSYVDGRREERRLYPGPMPGLLAAPTPLDPQQSFYGLQPRVSGITAPPQLYAELTAPSAGVAAPPLWARVELPAWGALTWLTVAGLGVVMVGLLAAGILAVYTYKTPDAIGPVVTITGYTFLAVLLLQVAGAAQRHWFPFPTLPPSVAETERGEPAMDGATLAVVTLLALTMLGLFVAAVLAVYTYSTSPAEGPVVILTALCGVLAMIVAIGGAISRRSRRT